MASMDIFKNNAFSMVSLTGTVERIPYVPQTLGALGIFEPMPVRSRNIFVEQRGQTLTLIPTSPLGAPPVELLKDGRNLVSLQTARLAKGHTLYAVEVEGIRAFGSETELKQVQAEFLRYMGQVRNDMELTHEYHRLGALQGKLMDADGVTVIYNYFTEFGIAEPAAVDFNLDSPTTNVLQISKDLARSMIQGSGGALGTNVEIHALAGNAFYDALTNHDQVTKTYLGWAAASSLRGGREGIGDPYGDFYFGGIYWHNYRGTDDNSTISIPTDTAKFFPKAPGVFKKAMAPAEFGPYINTLGQDTYMINIPDRDRQAWTRGEMYSYPLYICLRPDLLRKGVRT